MVSRDRDRRMDIGSTSYLVRVSRFSLENVLASCDWAPAYIRRPRASRARDRSFLPLSRSVAPRALIFHTSHRNPKRVNTIVALVRSGSDHIYTVDAAVGVLSP